MSYHGPATLVIDDNREIEVEVDVCTETAPGSGLRSWGGDITSPLKISDAGDVLHADDVKLRLPDGREGKVLLTDVLFRTDSDLATGAYLQGSGVPPYVK